MRTIGKTKEDNSDSGLASTTEELVTLVNIRSYLMPVVRDSTTMTLVEKYSGLLFIDIINKTEEKKKGEN